MIPAHLEKLIWEGKARYQHVVLGGSGINLIPVPNDTTIIIYQIVAYNFIDSRTGQIEAAYRRTINQMEFREAAKSNGTYFMLRADTDETFLAATATVQVKGHVTFNPYLIFSEDILVSFLANPALPWGATTGTLDSVGINSLKVPTGGSPAKGEFMNQGVTSIEYGDAVDTATVPVNIQKFKSAKSDQFNGMKFPYVDATQIQNFGPSANEDDALRTLPIVNVSYVQVDKAVGNKLKKTM